MICKICAQAVEESERKRPKEYTDEEYQNHLIEYHGYAAEPAPPPPVLSLKELNAKVSELEAVITEFAGRLDALEAAAPHSRKGGSK